MILGKLSIYDVYSRSTQINFKFHLFTIRNPTLPERSVRNWQQTTSHDDEVSSRFIIGQEGDRPLPSYSIYGRNALHMCHVRIGPTIIRHGLLHTVVKVVDFWGANNDEFESERQRWTPTGCKRHAEWTVMRYTMSWWRAHKIPKIHNSLRNCWGPVPRCVVTLPLWRSWWDQKMMNRHRDVLGSVTATKNGTQRRVVEPNNDEPNPDMLR